MIPPITDPLGRYWDQPSRREILTDDTHAVMTLPTFRKLAEYSSSLPSGVYDGKMWRGGTMQGRWQLYWYGPGKTPDMCSINVREILIIDAKEAE